MYTLTILCQNVAQLYYLLRQNLLQRRALCVVHPKQTPKPVLGFESCLVFNVLPVSGVQRPFVSILFRVQRLGYCQRPASSNPFNFLSNFYAGLPILCTSGPLILPCTTF